jgi:hypothetical protein
MRGHIQQRGTTTWRISVYVGRDANGIGEHRVVIGEGDHQLGARLRIEVLLDDVVDAVEGERAVEDLDLSIPGIDELGHGRGRGDRCVRERRVQPADVVRVVCALIRRYGALGSSPRLLLPRVVGTKSGGVSHCCQ